MTEEEKKEEKQEIVEKEDQKPEKKEEQKPEEKKHEPAENSKRWNEIYHEAKENKRQLDEINAKFAEQVELTDAIIAHNKALQAAYEKMELSMPEAERPDPSVDPDGFEKYILNKARNEGQPKPAFPEIKKEVKPKEDRTATIKKQEAVMRKTYADYDEVTSGMGDFLKENEVIARGIMFADNPAEELYLYAKKHGTKAEADRQKKLKQGYVEGGTPPVIKTVVKLTDAQKKVARGLGVSEENYIKQLNIINGGKK